MTPPLTVEAVGDALRGLGGAEPAGARRVRFRAAPGRLREALAAAAAALRCDRFIQLASVDTGREIELHYHLTGDHRTVVSVVAAFPREDPRAPTVADLFPPAGILERQVHDLLGVVFEGHPALDRIVLNDRWPAGEHPLRKDWKPREGAFYGGLPECPGDVPGAAAPPPADGEEGAP